MFDIIVMITPDHISNPTIETTQEPLRIWLKMR